MLFQKLAGIRELHPPSTPLKKIRAAPLLEMAYVQRDRRLAEMEDFGGSREILQPRALEKNFKAIRIHGIILFFSIRSPQLLETLISKLGFYIGQQMRLPNKNSCGEDPHEKRPCFCFLPNVLLLHSRVSFACAEGPSDDCTSRLAGHAANFGGGAFRIFFQGRVGNQTGGLSQRGATDAVCHRWGCPDRCLLSPGTDSGGGRRSQDKSTLGQFQ